MQTGFRAAGRAGLNEGMSEAVTEAIEPQIPVGAGLQVDSPDDVLDIRADDKGRIMKVCLQVVCSEGQRATL